MRVAEQNGWRGCLKVLMCLFDVHCVLVFRDSGILQPLQILHPTVTRNARHPRTLGLELTCRYPVQLVTQVITMVGRGLKGDE